MAATTLVRRVTADGGLRALKYSAVSVVGVVVTQVLLLLFHGLLAWKPEISNIGAVSIASIPAYYLNRAWVWGRTGKSHFLKEVVPFWGFAFVGLALSTFLVAHATDFWDSALAPNVANLAGFGSLWVLRYFVLDTVLFGGHPAEEVLEGDTFAVEPA